MTAAGTVAIEEIQAGDQVWAWNEDTGETELKSVVETYRGETDELTHVFMDGEKTSVVFKLYPDAGYYYNNSADTIRVAGNFYSYIDELNPLYCTLILIKKN